MTTLVPLLSEFDPVSTSEGSLDPLGLYTISDRLASRLVPGLRERMSHPRFLTAIAVGVVVCSEFDEDVVAKDGVTPPYQVYEWYVVQAMVKTFKETDDVKGLPGRDKATQALKNNVPLCAENYLETASVFGFHGVYRTLAENIDITRSGRLGEVGDRLVRVWEIEQDLKGFYMQGNGAGSSLRQVLTNAVNDGLKKGAVAREWYWSFNKIIAEKWAPYRAGSQELTLLFNTLCDETSSYRSQIIHFLISKEGTKCWVESESDNAENLFHKALIKHASLDLKELLECIQNYEKFARLLQDAFDDCLWYMSQKRGKTSLHELVNLDGIKKAHQLLPKLFTDVSGHLSQYYESGRFESLFGRFRENMDIKRWVELLLQHHVEVQEKKQPFGKNPWLFRLDDNSYAIRPLYCRDSKSRMDDSYVHAYRTRSLWSFMKDLKKIHHG